MMEGRLNIPAPMVLRYELESAKEAKRSRDWKCASKPVAQSQDWVRGVRELNLREERTR